MDEEEAVVAEEAPAPEAPPEAPAPAPDAPARYLVLARVFYTDAEGNEFFCGPGEEIDAAAAAQVDPASVEAL